MTQEERSIQTDRMRYTQDTMSANLVLIAIVFATKAPTFQISR